MSNPGPGGSVEFCSNTHARNFLMSLKTLIGGGGGAHSCVLMIRESDL